MTPYLVWSPEISVGIEEIDEQHKILLGFINKVHKAIHERDQVHLEQAMDALLEYTKVHCAVEESMMRVLHYPGHDHHKELHDDLIAQLERLRKRVGGGRTAATLELMFELKRWLLDHIQHDDKRYTGFFLAAGAKPTWQKRSWVDRLWARGTEAGGNAGGNE